MDIDNRAKDKKDRNHRVDGNKRAMRQGTTLHQEERTVVETKVAEKAPPPPKKEELVEEGPIIIQARFVNHMTFPVQVFWHNEHSKEKFRVIHNLPPLSTSRPRKLHSSCLATTYRFLADLVQV